jgi:hypothetical protein
MFQRIGVSDQPRVFRDGFTIIGFKRRNCYGSDGVLRLSIFFRENCQLFNLPGCENYCHIFQLFKTLLTHILLQARQLFGDGFDSLSEGEIIPFSGVSKSGAGASSMPGALAFRSLDIWR